MSFLGLLPMNNGAKTAYEIIALVKILWDSRITLKKNYEVSNTHSNRFVSNGGRILVFSFGPCLGH